MKKVKKAKRDFPLNKILILLLAVLILATIYVTVSKKQNSLTSPLSTQQIKEVMPSETLLEYKDPSGFSFAYPDNLSIVNNEASADEYADLTLSSKDVSGSLTLRIADSKFTSIDEWLNLNKKAAKEDPKETKLGKLKAIEVKTADRILLGALDQDVLFTIEVPRVEENFWTKVYSKLLTDFSFTAPQAAAPQGGSSYSEVIFEGEEVVE